MKRFFLGTVLCISITAVACNKDADEGTPVITETEAAEMVESTLTDRSGGATESMASSAELASSVTGCGVSGDTVLNYSRTMNGASFTSNATVNWSLICNNFNIPTGATVSTEGTTNFSATRWTGAGTAAGDYALTGLLPASQVYTINGQYAYSGTLTGNLRLTDPTVTTSLTYNFTDVTLNKQTYKVQSGSANFTLTATGSQGQTLMFNGTVVFNGNGTATVTINGNTFTINI